ncbi:MAG: GntR family transcriptional regulator [Clostridia bacterium]|nr:GntR family transcriptional regulator [Clostridia bacterium]
MLREAILNGKLRPGDRLVERELAEQLGVSRTPVREALRKLELENLVTHIPRKGVVVSEISRRDIIEILDIRASLEGLAARIGATKVKDADIDELKGYHEKMEEAVRNQDGEELNESHDQFNKKILEIAASPRLTQMVSSLWDYISRFTKMGYAVPGRTNMAMKEHALLIDALAARDAEAAERIAEEHIVNSKSVTLKQYEDARVKAKEA